jgi:hypothetical protein
MANTPQHIAQNLFHSMVAKNQIKWMTRKRIRRKSECQAEFTAVEDKMKERLREVVCGWTSQQKLAAMRASPSPIWKFVFSITFFNSAKSSSMLTTV